MKETAQYFTIKEASLWATNYLGKKVTASNISYLIQYGRIAKTGHNGSTQILKSELEKYYCLLNKSKETAWKEKLGQDLNWALSFDNLKEADTTKHIHRLHPYKGKFIPQLVEYFLDGHTDNFKTQKYFNKGDIVLDPFCGSGTTLAQANELGIHAIGIDVSSFNAFISNCKIADYDIKKLNENIEEITAKLYSKVKASKVIDFENALTEKLKEFNDKYFPVPEFKYKLRQNLIDEDKYGAEKEKLFLPTYNKLILDYKIELLKENPKNFLEKWYFKNTFNEIDFVFNEIKRVKNANIKKILSLILSRAMRSCRATTHADLATLLKPISAAYYCSKHGKICRPVFSILKWQRAYSKDTVNRLKEFSKLKTDTFQYCLTGDSAAIDIAAELSKKQKSLADLLQKQKISGIFSSPPYVGLINYHEQHAYAYDLFGFKRKDALEIGPLFKGQTKDAQKSYVEGVSSVLNNCKKYLKEDYNVFLVANDKYNLYPEIAKKAGMKIINQFKRPVLNRTEKDKAAYSEIIFHLKDVF
ncbi:MAG: site-specific DNA-methyltransferase [Endomicrobium sp.]|jgi:DNA modification methylase|nr:site-specific DNA-methyltransferase [Endomicrobium sp.]